MVSAYILSQTACSPRCDWERVVYHRMAHLYGVSYRQSLAEALLSVKFLHCQIVRTLSDVVIYFLVKALLMLMVTLYGVACVRGFLLL